MILIAVIIMRLLITERTIMRTTERTIMRTTERTIMRTTERTIMRTTEVAIKVIMIILRTMT